MKNENDTTEAILSNNATAFFAHLNALATPMNDVDAMRFAESLTDDAAPAAHTNHPALTQIVTGFHSKLLQLEKRALRAGGLSKTLEEQLYKWIDSVFVERGNATPRLLAGYAFTEYMSPPCTTEELLHFLRSFAAAYERYLRQRLSIDASDLSHGTATGARLHIATVCSDIELNSIRLQRLSSLRHSNAAGVELFCLAEFAGCTAEELATYFSIPERDVQLLLQNREYDIYDDPSF